MSAAALVIVEVAAQSGGNQDSTSSSTALQIITGIGVGTLIGSIIAAIVTQVWTSRRETKASMAKVAGIARMLSEDFFRQQSTLARAIFRQDWWRPAEFLDSQVSPDDLRDLASHLDSTHWGAVARVIGWMTYFRGVRAETRAAPTTGQLERFERLYSALDIARWVLSDVAKRPYHEHNPASMKQDAIAEVEAANGDVAKVQAIELHSLSADKAEVQLRERYD